MLSDEFTEQEKQKLEFASDIVFSYFPHLAGIFRTLDIRFSGRIETAAVTSSGKLLLNRDFFHRSKPGLETAFLLAHELLHLAQMIFERGKGFQDQESVNIAHDVLINELLCETMDFWPPPFEGLSWGWFYDQYIESETVHWEGHWRQNGLPEMKSKASLYSLEELVGVIISIKEYGYELDKYSWKKPISIPDSDSGPVPIENHPFADLFGEESDQDETSSEKDDQKTAGKGNQKTAEKDDQKTRGKITLDMIGDELEESLFPEEGKASRDKRKKELAEVCLDAASMNIIYPFLPGRMGGHDSPGLTSDVEIVRSRYSPPWEMAMQRWFDGVAVPKRSWARASRRGAWRNDVVLPGRDQECFILHIILDTSGSMTQLIPPVLSQISAFARNVGMTQVHIIQCDTDIREDEYVEIDQLEKYRVEGYGGNDMNPAMLKLAEDPEISSVLIITDGFFSESDYPPETAIPYDVLWCIPDEGHRHSFLYGQVIYVPITD